MSKRLENSIGSLEEVIRGMTDLLYGGGVEFDAGCSLEKMENYWNHAKSICDGKPVRVIRSWQWWDFQKEALLDRGDDHVLPSLLVGHVVRDTSYRFGDDDWLRTTPILAVHDNVIVETKNTFYVLLGKGIRKTVDINLVALLHS